jgi:ABC-type transport system involved in multi-copper enzyme maturation permease subunit
MLGPVLFQELLLGSRRNRLYVLRWCYAGWLLLQLGFMGFTEILVRMPFRRTTSLEIADTAHAYVQILVTQHFILLLLAVPTMTAGAITDEKSRGTLQYLLTTELHPWELIVGKLIARSWMALSLTLPVLPLLCTFGVLGGMDLGRLLAVLAVTVLLIVGLASASLLASALCKHTRDGVLALYGIGLALYVASLGLHAWMADLALAAELGETTETAAPLWRRLAAVLDAFNPLQPLGPSWALDDPGERGRRLLAALAAWGTLAVVCLALAAWRLRPAYLRYLESQGRKKRRWWQAQRAPLGDDPIRWKERQVEGIAPLAVVRDFPRWLGLLLVATATTFVCGGIFLSHLPGGIGPLWEAVRTLDFEAALDILGGAWTATGDFNQLGSIVGLLATLVVAIRCSGAITGERERRTWEALLLTPLETRTLIRGKFWGILGSARPYLIAYAVPALTFSLLCGPVAVFWTALWLAITVLALAYAGAAGLWCSVMCSTSWRSLLLTLGVTYLGGFVMTLVNAVVGCVFAMLLGLVLMVMGPQAGNVMGGLSGVVLAMTLFQVGLCLGLAGAFVLAAWRLLVSAEYRVGVLERTKHWRDAPPSFAPRPVLSGWSARVLEPEAGRAPDREP